MTDQDFAREKQCPICGEKIWIGASKCIHCSADLTWRRYLAFSNTTLALVTALISVAATSAPVYYRLATPDNSKLSAVFVGISTSGETVSMLYSNYGRRTGAINKIWISILYKNSNEIRLFSIYPKSKNDGAIAVKPGQTIDAQFYMSGAQTHWRPENAADDDLARLSTNFFWHDAKCSVETEGTNADGSPYRERLNFDCQGRATQIFRHVASQLKKS